MTPVPFAGSFHRFIRVSAPRRLTGNLNVFGGAAAAGFARWVHLESEHVDAQVAKQVERAVQLCSVEHLTMQHRSRRKVILLDPGKAFAEPLIEPSPNPYAHVRPAPLPVLVVSPHTTSVRPLRVIPHHPFRQPPGVVS